MSEPIGQVLDKLDAWVDEQPSFEHLKFSYQTHSKLWITISVSKRHPDEQAPGPSTEKR